MRLKASPTDFVVEEVTDLRIRKQPDRYKVYLLEKQGWNTVDALIRIAGAAGVPLRRFAYGGKKDRHAHTFQYVTVDHPADLSTAAAGYRFRLLGHSPEPMGPERILCNRFTVTVRDLSPAERDALLAGLEQIGRTGFINYFDDQRFGSLDRERGFAGEYLLRGQWEEALAIALTAVHPEESRAARERKRALRARWGDWQACLALAGTRLEEEAFRRLAAAPVTTPAAFRAALGAVPREQLAMWAAAYQGFLWNEVVRRLLEARGWAARQAPGRAGPYLFPDPADPAVWEAVRRWQCPLPGRGMRPGPEVEPVLRALLAERGVSPAALTGPPPVPGAEFRASPRPVVVTPADLTVRPPVPDERYPGRERVTVAFALPRGAYATMLFKAATARPLRRPAPPGSRP